MSKNHGGHEAAGAGRLSQGPYVLREVLAKVPLGEGVHNGKNAYITCVEHWDRNLYVGTSAGELIHFVALPTGNDDGDSSTLWIQGSRRDLVPEDGISNPGQDLSVRQILILPSANKALVLSQGTITIYTLPELTPTLTSTKLYNCTWVGGQDQDADPSEGSAVIMICQRGILRLVKVGDRISKVRDINFNGCLVSARRGDIACVADYKEYSLLDVVAQQRIPLFPISSESQPDAQDDEELVSPAAAAQLAPVESMPATEADNVLPEHVTEADPKGNKQGQPPTVELLEDELSVARSDFIRPDASEPSHPAPQVDTSDTGYPQQGSDLALAESKSPTTSARVSSEVQHTPTVTQLPLRTSSRPRALLRPVIATPNSIEFLLATGSSIHGPGLGIFINTDGEPTREPMEFSSYPVSICVDGGGVDMTTSLDPSVQASEGYVLALVTQKQKQRRTRAIQIRQWEMHAVEPTNMTYWLDLDSVLNEDVDKVKGFSGKIERAGLRTTADELDCKLKDVVEIIGSAPLLLRHGTDSSPRDEKKIRQRQRAEGQLYDSMATFKTKMVVWADDCIWSVTRNPLAFQMEVRLQEALGFNQDFVVVNRNSVESILKDIHDLEPNSGLEFYTLNYIRQKGSILLFLELLSNTNQSLMIYDRDRRVTAEAMSRGDIDPRILLSLISDLSQEIIEGPEGIWVQQGLKTVLERVFGSRTVNGGLLSKGESGFKILQMIKDYLLLWRNKKGLESITDKDNIFASVDAALLRLLLTLDARSVPGPAKKGSVRAELNHLIEAGVDCFDRAVALFEEFHRLYVLSWLYETYKMPGLVLATWKRILEGEKDLGAELGDGGEAKLRRYLARVNNREIVCEFGTWLARRNPTLGVRVFADTNSNVTFAPKEAVDILKRDAPGAVKTFLEHLVFDNNFAAYATDLISYYLDSVLSELGTSGPSRAMLLSSYQAYRAQRAPKPTYSQFAADQQLDAEWWRNRLRLLQLLGGSHGAASQYDVPGMLQRIAPYEQELVPEMIVLAGKQGQHAEAIRLLVHGLGDYDTAVSYCLLGGSSTYSPLSGSLPKESAPSREEQEALFAHLFNEFLALEDINDQIGQTSELLERFAGWFDPIYVISTLPETWSVDMISSFLETSLRHLVTEHNETTITKALLNADNLTANFALIEKLEVMLPLVEQVDITTN